MQINTILLVIVYSLIINLVIMLPLVSEVPTGPLGRTSAAADGRRSYQKPLHTTIRVQPKLLIICGQRERREGVWTSENLILSSWYNTECPRK